MSIISLLGYSQADSLTPTYYFESIDYYMSGDPLPINKTKAHKNQDSIYVKMPYLKVVDSSGNLILYNYIAQSLFYKFQYEIKENYFFRQEEYDNDMSWIKNHEFIGDNKRWRYRYEKKNSENKYILQSVSIDKPYTQKTYYIKLDYEENDKRFLPDNFNPKNWIIDVVEIQEFHFVGRYLYDCKRKFVKDGASYNIIEEEYIKVKMTENYYWYRNFPAMFGMKEISLKKCKHLLNNYANWEQVLQF